MEKTQIKAEIVADSLSPQGDRLTSLLITFPRIILAEVNTHRMLSKNTSSSRAIPFKKMVESVQNDPFIPIAWQKHHSGMQGSEYWKDDDWVVGIPRVSKYNPVNCARGEWLKARDEAVKQAERISKKNITKQLCNRLLEPFMWTTMLITGSKEGWDNFFKLRCPSYYGQYPSWKQACMLNSSLDYEESILNKLLQNKGQAEIHIMDLAEKIYDAMSESTPKQLKAGEWHIPFADKIDTELSKWEFLPNIHELWGKDMSLYLVKVSTAMAARTSYTVVGDEKEIDYKRMIELHDRLIEMRHDSPLEHCAKAMNMDEYYLFSKGQDGQADHQHGWCRNFKGFIQYRHIIETEKQ